MYTLVKGGRDDCAIRWNVVTVREERRGRGRARARERQAGRGARLLTRSFAAVSFELATL